MQSKLLLLLFLFSFFKLDASEPSATVKSEQTTQNKSALSSQKTTDSASTTESTALAICQQAQGEKTVPKRNFRKFMIEALKNHIPIAELCSTILSYSLETFMKPINPNNWWGGSLLDFTLVNFDNQVQVFPTWNPRGSASDMTYSQQVQEMYSLAFEHLSTFQQSLEKHSLTRESTKKLIRNADRLDLHSIFFLLEGKYGKKMQTIISGTMGDWQSNDNPRRSHTTHLLPFKSPTMIYSITYDCKRKEFVNGSQEHDFFVTENPSLFKKLVLKQIGVIIKDIVLNLKKIQEAVEQENGKKLTGELDLCRNYLASLKCNFH